MLAKGRSFFIITSFVFGVFGFAPKGFAAPNAVAVAYDQMEDFDSCEVALTIASSNPISNPHKLSDAEKNGLILYLSMYPTGISKKQVEWLIWELEDIKNENEFELTAKEAAEAIKSLKQDGKLLHANKFSNWFVFKLSIPQHNSFYEPLRQAEDFKQLVEFFESKLGWKSKAVLSEVRPGQYLSFSVDGYTKALVIPAAGKIEAGDLQEIYGAIRKNKFYVSSQALAAYVADAISFEDLEYRLGQLGEWGKKKLAQIVRPENSSATYSKEQKSLIYEFLVMQ